MTILVGRCQLCISQQIKFIRFNTIHTFVYKESLKSLFDSDKLWQASDNDTGAAAAALFGATLLVTILGLVHLGPKSQGSRMFQIFLGIRVTSHEDRDQVVLQDCNERTSEIDRGCLCEFFSPFWRRCWGFNSSWHRCGIAGFLRSFPVPRYVLQAERRIPILFAKRLQDEAPLLSVSGFLCWNLLDDSCSWKQICCVANGHWHQLTIDSTTSLGTNANYWPYPADHGHMSHFPGVRTGQHRRCWTELFAHQVESRFKHSATSGLLLCKRVAETPETCAMNYNDTFWVQGMLLVYCLWSL